MEIKFEAAVYCRDGMGGKISHILINQRSWKVSFVVVSEGKRDGNDWLIPLRMVELSANNDVWLNCTLAQLRQFECFTLLHMPSLNLFESVDRMNGLAAYAMLEASLHSPCELNIPTGYQSLYWGTEVGAADGDIGRIDAVRFEDRYQLLSELVIRQGHLWFKKRYAVPARNIERIEPEVVQLNVDRCQIEAMLAVRPHHS